MTTKEKIKVMQAFLEGKVVQCRNRILDGYWLDIDKVTSNYEPDWDFKLYEYKVKSEPKYRPYNSVEEFLQASKEHGPYLRKKSWRDSYKLPTFIGFDFMSISKVDDFGNTKSWNFRYSDMDCDEWKWQDGTPCGIFE